MITTYYIQGRNGTKQRNFKSNRGQIVKFASIKTDFRQTLQH